MQSDQYTELLGPLNVGLTCWALVGMGDDCRQLDSERSSKSGQLRVAVCEASVRHLLSFSMVFTVFGALL